MLTVEGRRHALDQGERANSSFLCLFVLLRASLDEGKPTHTAKGIFIHAANSSAAFIPEDTPIKSVLLVT